MPEGALDEGDSCKQMGWRNLEGLERLPAKDLLPINVTE